MRLSGSGYNLGYTQVATAQRTGIGLPVPRHSVIYSYYEHVHGYSAGENSPTVPISKIRILNSLIENISRLKRDTPSKSVLSETGKISSGALGALVDSHLKELHSLVCATQRGFNVPETGMLVSLTA